MKKLLLLNILILSAIFIISDVAMAQQFPPIDKSPVDISMYPRRGPNPIFKVVYGRPQKNGRVVFGELEKFGKVWRTGANEATEITFGKEVKLGGNTIKAGTYTLFTIPEKDSWTIILNSELNQWGAYNYKESADVLRYKVPVTKSSSTIEAFSIIIEKTDKGADMVLGWDDTIVRVPFEFN
jgi:hypothetical protein